MAPTVNVHIVTYNSESFIKDCIEAVLNQSYPIQQIIVIDNKSTDGTRDILKLYQSRIVVFYNEENTGFAAAHNQAINMASSDYILVLNPDVVLYENYLSELLVYAARHPSVGSLTGRLLLKSTPHLIDSTGLMINKQRRVFDRGSNEPADQWMKSAEVFGVSGAAALYSKKMIDDISVMGQFYDDDFFAYKEDVDVAWRGQLLGWTSYYVASAIAYHERGWKQGLRSRQPLFVRRYSYINRYKMMFKNECLSYLFLHIVPIVLYEFAMNCYFLLKEPKVLGAWKSCWKKLTRLRRQRRIILQRRKVPYSTVYSHFRNSIK